MCRYCSNVAVNTLATKLLCTDQSILFTFNITIMLNFECIKYLSPASCYHRSDRTKDQSDVNIQAANESSSENDYYYHYIHFVLVRRLSMKVVPSWRKV